MDDSDLLDCETLAKEIEITEKRVMAYRSLVWACSVLADEIPELRESGKYHYYNVIKNEFSELKQRYSLILNDLYEKHCEQRKRSLA